MAVHVQTNGPDFISQEILAALYVLLALAGGLVLTGRYHATATTLRVFATCIVLNATARVIYFGIPDEIWGTSITPADATAFSRAWWGNLAQAFFYLFANFSAVASYMTILHMWQHAHAIVRGHHADVDTRPARAIALFVALVGICSLLVLLAYVVTPYQMALIIQCIMNVVINIGVAVWFVYYWWYLSRALNEVVNQAKAASDVIASPLPDGSGMLVHLNDGDGDTVARSKQKLHRFSAVCALYTLCALIKAGFITAEMIFAVQNMGFDANSWWIILFVFYTLTEFSTSMLVLIIMRKAKPSRVSRGSAAASLLYVGGSAQPLSRSSLFAASRSSPTRGIGRSPVHSGTRKGAAATGAGANVPYHIIATQLE